MAQAPFNPQRMAELYRLCARLAHNASMPEYALYEAEALGQVAIDQLNYDTGNHRTQLASSIGRLAIMAIGVHALSKCTEDWMLAEPACTLNQATGAERIMAYIALMGPSHCAKAVTNTLLESKLGLLQGLLDNHGLPGLCQSLHAEMTRLGMIGCHDPVAF